MGIPPLPERGSAGGLSHVEALKARREKREAALDAKARGSAPSLSQNTFGKAASTQPNAARPPAQSTQAKSAAQIHGSVRTQDINPALSEGVLLQALLNGLGFPDAKIEPENAERLMLDTGKMVREMSSGMIALLAARKIMKSEFRMDETRIEPKENNAFKHFKVAELALDEMLLRRSEGYLPPDQASRAAFQDLQDQTMVTISAMQKAMRLLLERISPENLAGHDENDGALRLRSLGGRRDKWDTAKQSYERIRSDFDAIMRQVIIEAFTQVQEELARQRSKDYWDKRKK
ncbi:type VI secretion system-associated FHA domain protein TagH [Roseibium hamelinense]|nr:type VI secretion system-associated FHA domain protein TagH [Roseibium hamelinense]